MLPEKTICIKSSLSITFSDVADCKCKHVALGAELIERAQQTI